MKVLNSKCTYFYFFALAAIVVTTDAASIRNKIVKTINGTAQTLVDGTLNVTLPLESSTSTGRRVWITYERGQRTSVLSTMEISRIISTHMTPIYDFPAMSSVVTMATDEEIAAMMANSTIGPINVTDDPIRYRTVHSTKNVLRGQRNLQSGEVTPYGIFLTQVDQLREATGLTGEGITVCVIDSGLDATHPDLNTAGYDGISLIYGSTWNFDSNGHGTHVTGIVAASDNTFGVVGAAPGANIYTVDIFGDNEYTYASALFDAVYKCRDANAKIINMSLSGPVRLDLENKLFSDLYNYNGILSIAAAGNEGDSEYRYPASYDTVLSVGAIDSSKNLASFSTFNNRVDLVAPGVDVLSTLPSGSCELCFQTLQSTYGYLSGTSQATPYVSGIAALLWSSNVNLGANMIYDALINSAEDLGSSGRDNFYGNGLVAALAAYNSLTSSSGTAPPVSSPVSSPASSPVANTPTGGSCLYASLTFRSDSYPWETYIKLTDQYSGAVLWYYGASAANTDYAVPSICLNPNGCYFFLFYDDYGDGLMGSGFFELSLDNTPVASGTDFGYYASYNIGYGCTA